MIDDILRAVQRCAREPSDPVDEWVRPYGPRTDPEQHQFVVILKPELLASTVEGGGRDLLAWVLETLDASRIHAGAARVVSGRYVGAHGLVESHWGTLNAISRDGYIAIPESARERLRDVYPWTVNRSDRIVGGHRFLELVRDFSPVSLDTLTENVRVVKLGAGAYTIEVTLQGEPWIILNAFHPRQAAHFAKAGAAIGLLECVSDRPLSDIRRHVIGATDPRQAERGSIRRELVDGKRWSGRWTVCTSLNAIHASPSAVEAMFAIQRYFGAHDSPLAVGDTVLGARLLEAGAEEDRLQSLAANPEVCVAGSRGPLFEITEDVAEPVAASMVLELLAGQRAGATAGER